MLSISFHAVERYVERIDPSANYDSAREAIAAAFAESSRLRERSRAGDAYFAAETMKLIVAEERGRRTVLTVLPPGRQDALDHSDIPEEARELALQFQQWSKAQASGGATPGETRVAKVDRENARLRGQLRVLEEALKRRRADLAAFNVRRQKIDCSAIDLRAQLEAAHRRLEKARAHADRMDQDRQDIQKTLWKIVDYFVAAGDLAEVSQIRAIIETDPNFSGMLSYRQRQVDEAAVA